MARQIRKSQIESGVTTPKPKRPRKPKDEANWQRMMEHATEVMEFWRNREEISYLFKADRLRNVGILPGDELIVKPPRNLKGGDLVLVQIGTQVNFYVYPLSVKSLPIVGRVSRVVRNLEAIEDQ